MKKTTAAKSSTAKPKSNLQQRIDAFKQQQVETVTTVTTTTTTVKRTKKRKAAPPVTHIRFIIDRSGSMQSIKTDTIGGFNGFLEEQRAQPGKAKITYVQFDHEIETVYRGIDINEVPPLNALTYQPRGYTALYDAIGRTLQEGLNDTKSSDEHNILVVLTDGAENSSKEHTQWGVKNMMKRAEEKGWQVIFLGANIDVAQVSAGIGMHNARSIQPGWDQKGVWGALGPQGLSGPITMNYAATADGISSAYSTASSTVSLMRSMRAKQDTDPDLDLSDVLPDV